VITKTLKAFCKGVKPHITINMCLGKKEDSLFLGEFMRIMGVIAARVCAAFAGSSVHAKRIS
jgi:hypothetical protein